MTTNALAIARAEKHLLPNYRPAPMVLTRGEGCRVWDVEEREYLDFAGGIAVLILGHSHPRLARAIELGELLVTRSGFGRAFFCNSGAEANEAMLKLARRYHHDRGAKDRVEFVATHNSFHGRTYGALSITGQPKYHVGLGPLLPGVHFVPYNDIAAMRNVVDERTAAVILEPIQGEGGVAVGRDEYLREVRTLCDERGALLLFDEVQTGYGRTGRFLCREWSRVMPDACSVAKGIGGGFPLGAMLTQEHVAAGLPPGSHATTFGGNALACAAGVEVLRVLEDERLVARAEAMGSVLADRLAQALVACAQPSEVRGRGLLLGVPIPKGVDPQALLGALRDERLLLTLAGGDVLRFTPPLIVSEEEIAQAVDVFKRVLERALSKGGPS